MENSLHNSGVWITWERQTRNRSASSYLGIPLFEINSKSSNRLVRYTSCIAKTIRILIREKPRFLFAQNPSVVLALLCVFLGKIFKLKIIIDAHSSGVYGPERLEAPIRAMNNFVIRNCSAVIVTNDETSLYIKSVGGRPIVLPDPLPELSVNFKIESVNNDRLKAFCITSWSEDEPFLQILSAAERFEHHVDIVFSGNYKKVSNLLPEKLPRNVSFLGFVSEEDFLNHLFSSDFCIDMTKRQDCMVCGAYESISAGKPIILSDTEVQKLYFEKGAVFCGNSCDEIAVGIGEMCAGIERYKTEALELKSEILEAEIKKKSFYVNELLNL